MQLDGARCAEARLKLGLSRESLSDHARGNHPLSVATIKRAEQGQPLYLGTASRLAEVLRVPLDELLDSRCINRHPAPLQHDSNGLPALAVMPFKALGEGATYFSEGLADDLVTRLSRWWFPVIARGSAAFAAPGRVGSELEAELGADYLVEGNVRRSDGLVRVSVRLVRADTGQVLWASHYDRRLNELLAAQDELTAQIVKSVSQGVLQAATHRSVHRDPSNMAAWDLALLGAWYFNRRNAKDNGVARDLLAKALQREPCMAFAWYFLALTHQQDIFHQWSDAPKESLHHLCNISAEFQSRYPGEAAAHVASAYSRIYAGQRDAAMAHLTLAIELDPNLCNAYSLYGQTLAMANEPDRALEQFETALRLSPQDSERWAIHLSMALSHFVAERYDDAILCAGRAMLMGPHIAFTHGVVASCHAHLGDLVTARHALSKMMRAEPRSCAGGFSLLIASTNPEIAGRYLAGLRSAGLPG